MSIDLQVCIPQEAVSLTQVRILPGVSPRTLDCLGSDFRAVDEVMINGQPSPDVVVVSRTRLLAQVPDTLRNDTITSVTVTSNRLTMTASSLIRFRLGATPGKVTGILRLVQVFLKLLFTRPGSDIFSPRVGGNALSGLGSTFGRDDGGGVVSDFVLSVATTQRQLLAIQARDPSLPLDERLLSAKVVSASFNKQEAALIVSVELTSQSGRSALANVQW